MNQKIIKTIIILSVVVGLIGCSGNKHDEKGFPVNSVENDDENKDGGISKDSLVFETKPSSVLLTGIPQYRLTTIYKVNNAETNKRFIGSNNFYFNYEAIGETNGNQWHNNFIPGFEAVYGYNMVNVSHYDTLTQKDKNFFEKPVLIKSLYYPSFTKDTLNYIPVNRNYFMISFYDEDTNKDGYINLKDLRRFYWFDKNINEKQPLIPLEYSVYKSEYDPANDFIYVFANLDKNKNGQIDNGESTSIFWIDLKKPERKGKQY